MSFLSQNLEKIPGKVLDANEEWNRVSLFFDTKKRWDSKHGTTRINEWFYICFDTGDSRGDIPWDAWQFVHMSQLPDLQIRFSNAQKNEPRSANYMTFDILWRVTKYIPYVHKQQRNLSDDF